MSNTIDQIRDAKNKCFENLDALHHKNFPDQTFGQEREFTAKNLIQATHELLTNVTALTKSPAKFIRKSTYDERIGIFQNLNNLNNYLLQKNLNQIVSVLRTLLPLVRNISWDFRREYLSTYSETANSIDARMSELSSNAASYESLGGKIADSYRVIQEKEEVLDTKLQELEDKNSELNTQLQTLQSKIVELQSVVEEEKGKSTEITDLLNTSKAHEAVVSSFSKRVEKRETQLEGQEEKTSEFVERLEELEKNYHETTKKMETERQGYLTQAQTLIESSKQALEFGTAEGLSAAFDKQQKKAIEQKPGRWLIGSLVFLGLVIWLGLDLLGNDFEWQVVLVRLSLIPLLVAGIWFCAGQYVKIKNLAEDYAFKTALAQSIVGFSDQLSDSEGKGEVYKDFILSTMAQIHKDPLRKHSIKSQELEASNFRSEIQKQSTEILRLQKLISSLVPREL